MTKRDRIDKKCGGLRGTCGGKKVHPPQVNFMILNALTPVRGIAGVPLSHVRVRMHMRAHAHARTVGIYPPHVPATGLNSLNDRGLRCGGWVKLSPAVPPQIAGVTPAVDGVAS